VKAERRKILLLKIVLVVLRARHSYWRLQIKVPRRSRGRGGFYSRGKATGPRQPVNSTSTQASSAASTKPMKYGIDDAALEHHRLDPVQSRRLRAAPSTRRERHGSRQRLGTRLHVRHCTCATMAGPRTVTNSIPQPIPHPQEMEGLATTCGGSHGFQVVEFPYIQTLKGHCSTN
jgi:hypothetical protein